MKNDIRDIAEPHAQTDPDFKNDFLYIKITAEAVRKSLIAEKGYDDRELPAEDTIGNILNRMGYTLKRVMKTKPLKKFPEPMRYSEMSGKQTAHPMRIRNLRGFPLTAEPRLGSVIFPGTADPGIRQAEKQRIMI